MKRPSLFQRCATLLPVAVLSLSVGLAQAQDADFEESLYGRQMTTQQERDQIRQRLHSTRSLEERQQIHSEYQQMIRQRAMERGFDPDGIYGRQMMDPQERRAFAERMQGAGSAEERQRIQAEHRQQMRQRIMEERGGRQGQQQRQQQQQQQRQQLQQPGSGRGGVGRGRE
ncbi:hypothetical protein [Halomonas sp. JS92-SW72]|uniref:hypothetical protein n=1 Tax=Halomonas sp. JS92-SW72 TaxID=2306583 RepID=UPI000E5C2A0D|nr:hypothetical protein [Halomonas sp. JS92-SW72]AXY42505.1 hypothetical protein D1793_09980 [Halomonas sp. JS92-SW72]